MTHTEIEHEPMSLIIRASGMAGRSGSEDVGCDDLGLYVPDMTRPRRLTTPGSPFKMYPKKWISLFDGLDDNAKAILKMNITEAFYEDLKTDIEHKEEQGRE